jgi:hypothetical protein
MMFDGLINGLRWVFWGTVYALVLLTALVLVMSLPLPSSVRLGFMLVFVWGIVLDVRRKREPASA